VEKVWKTAVHAPIDGFFEMENLIVSALQVIVDQWLMADVISILSVLI